MKRTHSWNKTNSSVWLLYPPVYKLLVFVFSMLSMLMSVLSVLSVTVLSVSMWYVYECTPYTVSSSVCVCEWVRVPTNLKMTRTNRDRKTEKLAKYTHTTHAHALAHLFVPQQRAHRESYKARDNTQQTNTVTQIQQPPQQQNINQRTEQKKGKSLFLIVIGTSMLTLLIQTTRTIMMTMKLIGKDTYAQNSTTYNTQHTQTLTQKHQPHIQAHKHETDTEKLNTNTITDTNTNTTHIDTHTHTTHSTRSTLNAQFTQ